jgi:hypothetical protein
VGGRVSADVCCSWVPNAVVPALSFGHGVSTWALGSSKECKGRVPKLVMQKFDLWPALGDSGGAGLLVSTLLRLLLQGLYCILVFRGATFSMYDDLRCPMHVSPAF